MEIGDREGEAEVYVNLGAVSECLRKYRKSKEYYDKALSILREIGRKGKETNVYENLGVLQQSLGDNFQAKNITRNLSRSHFKMVTENKKL